MLPLGLLSAAQGHPMLVELKNGETLNGHLVNSDTWMNLTLKEVVQTSPDGDKFFRLPEVYVRGNNIKFLRVPDEIIDLVKESQQNQQPSRGGRGGGQQRGDHSHGGRGDGGHRGDRGRGGGPDAFSRTNPMTTTKVAIDSLWRCLRPAFSSSTAVRLPNAVSLHAGIYTTSLRTPPDEIKFRTKPFYSKSPHNPRPREQPKGRLSSEELTNCSNDTLYGKLLWDSLEGNFRQTQQIVDYLVRERHEQPSLTLYAALIQSNICPLHGSAGTVAAILNEMKEEGLVPDSDVYSAVLQVLSVHPDYILRNTILDEMHQRWFNLNRQGWHDLICGLIRERQYELALDKIEHLQRSSVRIASWLYDQLTYALCDAEELDEALKIMKFRVIHEEQRISGNSWYRLLDTASRWYHYDATRYVWKKRVETHFINPSDGLCLNVLNTAARHGDPVLATEVFRVLSNRSVKLEMYHYEALLEAYTGGGDVKSALTVLCAMRDVGIDVSEASTRAIYKSLREQSKGPREAFEALRLLRKDGRKIPIAAINCILDALSFQGNAILALEHYKQLRSLCPDGPNTTTFNVLVRACGVSHRKDLAMFLVSEMQAVGISPDLLTYDRLLLVCLQEDNYEDAFKYLEEMERRGWAPRPGTWKALVARCVTAGDQRAWELVNQMDEKGLDTVKIRDWLSEAWGKSGGLETTEKLELGKTGGHISQGGV
ncbi:MAG: hypothetical protein M1840_007425 [Geoglossum simile]|nr:MAG: hypothetical protein M1840_007425 [Geoglossum simile]